MPVHILVMGIVLSVQRTKNTSDRTSDLLTEIQMTIMKFNIMICYHSQNLPLLRIRPSFLSSSIYRSSLFYWKYNLQTFEVPLLHQLKWFYLLIIISFY